MVQGSKQASGDSEDGTAASTRRENGARAEPQTATLTRPPPKEVAAGDLKRADEADPDEQTALTRAPIGLPAPVHVDRRPRFVRPILKCALPQVPEIRHHKYGCFCMTRRDDNLSTS